MILPSGIRDLTKFTQTVIEICRVSQGTRAAVYRNYGEWIETGAPTGGLALANMLNSHIDRLRAFLFPQPIFVSMSILKLRRTNE